MTVVVRETKETMIRCELTIGTGLADVSTDQSFLDHMLVAFARYSGLDLVMKATGDLPHHLIEDVAICVGAAVAELLPGDGSTLWRSHRADGRSARALRARSWVAGRTIADRFRAPCTIIGCARSATMRERRCTSVCCAAPIVITSSKRRSRRSALPCAMHSSTQAPCSARRAASRCASRSRRRC